MHGTTNPLQMACSCRNRTSSFCNMRGECDCVDSGEEHAEGDHVPRPVLEGEWSNQGLPEEVEEGTRGNQTRHQADVAEGGDG